MRASYEASYLIAKSSKPFSVGENLVLPAAVKMSKIVYGKKYGDDIRIIPLSNDTVVRRIAEISDDQFEQLIIRLKRSPKFTIQLDETIDVSKNAQLLLYVRYVHEENVKKNYFFVDLWKVTPKVKISSLKSMNFLRLHVYNGKIALEFVQMAQGQWWASVLNLLQKWKNIQIRNELHLLIASFIEKHSQPNKSHLISTLLFETLSK